MRKETRKDIFMKGHVATSLGYLKLENVKYSEGWREYLLLTLISSLLIGKPGYIFLYLKFSVAMH